MANMAEALRTQPLVELVDFLLPFLAVLWKDWPKGMELSSFSGPNDGNFTLRGECPHCSDKAAFMPVTRSWHEENPLPGGDKWIAALRCVSCRKYILGVVGFVSTPASESVLQCLEYYPLGNTPQIKSDDIPPHVLEDFNEALRCRGVKAYNATVEMCRRALQASCFDKGAPDKKLEDQIDWLAANTTAVPPLLQKAAHVIRQAGNRGAHPPSDPKAAKLLEENHADDVIRFTHEFFYYVYEMPSKLGTADFSKKTFEKKP
jgi:hypothetical protein